MSKLNIRKTLRTTAAVALTLAMSAAFCFVPNARAEISRDSRTFTIYEWDRVNSVKNDKADGGDDGDKYLPRSYSGFPAILVWDESGEKYYTGGRVSTGYNWKDNVGWFTTGARMRGDPDMRADVETFYTIGDRDAFYFYYVGEDHSGANNGRKYYITLDTGSSSRPYLGISYAAVNDFLNFEGGPHPFEKDVRDMAFTISSSLEGTSENHVKVFYNRESHTDTGWQVYYDKNKYTAGDRIWGKCDSSTETYSQFTMYVATPVNFKVLTDDVTEIGAGQTFPIDDKTILPEGSKLVIEKGAVVTVKGLFLNNGVIENHGTLLVQNTGTITSFDLKKNSMTDGYLNGSLVTDGGGIIVQTGGAIIFKQYCGGLTVRDGGTCVNGGAIVSPGDIDLTDGTLDIRKTGAIFCGYDYAGLIGDFTTGKRKTDMTDRPALTIYNPESADYKYGGWEKMIATRVSHSVFLGKTGHIFNAGALCSDSTTFILNGQVINSRLVTTNR